MVSCMIYFRTISNVKRVGDEETDWSLGLFMIYKTEMRLGLSSRVVSGATAIHSGFSGFVRLILTAVLTTPLLIAAPLLSECRCNRLDLLDRIEIERILEMGQKQLTDRYW